MCRKGSHGRVSIDRLNWEAINISTDTQLTLQLILSWHSIDTQLRDQSFIRGRWAGANGVEATPFCAPENKGLHKILQPFLRGHVHVFLCSPISFLQKRYKTEAIGTKSNIIYYYIKVSGIPSGKKLIKIIRYPHMWKYDILTCGDIDDFTDIKFVP